MNPFVDFKMQGEVQSYDLLQNEKYGRLDELKNVLENSVSNKGANLNGSGGKNSNRA